MLCRHIHIHLSRSCPLRIFNSRFFCSKLVKLKGCSVCWWWSPEEASQKPIRRVCNRVNGEGAGLLSAEVDDFVRVWPHSQTELGWICAEDPIDASRAGWLPSVVLDQVEEEHHAWLLVHKTMEATHPNQLDVKFGQVLKVNLKSRTPEGWAYAYAVSGTSSKTNAAGWVPVISLCWEDDNEPKEWVNSTLARPESEQSSWAHAILRLAVKTTFVTSSQFWCIRHIRLNLNSRHTYRIYRTIEVDILKLAASWLPPIGVPCNSRRLGQSIPSWPLLVRLWRSAPMVLSATVADALRCKLAGCELSLYADLSCTVLELHGVRMQMVWRKSWTKLQGRLWTWASKNVEKHGNGTSTNRERWSTDRRLQISKHLQFWALHCPRLKSWFLEPGWRYRTGLDGFKMQLCKLNTVRMMTRGPRTVPCM